MISYIVTNYLWLYVGILLNKGTRQLHFKHLILNSTLIKSLWPRNVPGPLYCNWEFGKRGQQDGYCYYNQYKRAILFYIVERA